MVKRTAHGLVNSNSSTLWIAQGRATVHRSGRCQASKMAPHRQLPAPPSSDPLTLHPPRSVHERCHPKLASPLGNVRIPSGKTEDLYPDQPISALRLRPPVAPWCLASPDTKLKLPKLPSLVVQRGCRARNLRPPPPTYKTYSLQS